MAPALERIISTGHGIQPPSAARRPRSVHEPVRQDPLHHRRVRGIGLAIAVRAALDGARIAIAAKTTEAHPKLPGTIHSAAEASRPRRPGAAACATSATSERRSRGRADGRALRRHRHPRQQRQRDQPDADAGTPMKRFDLMFGVNVRGTYCCTQACLPHCKRAQAGATRTCSTCRPPLSMKPHWFAATSPTRWPSTA
jgi:citronellol/citronellal dehydrogenase